MQKKGADILSQLKDYINITSRTTRLIFSERPVMISLFILVTLILAISNFATPAIIAVLINKIQFSLQGAVDVHWFDITVVLLVIANVVPYIFYPINSYFEDITGYYFQQVIELKIIKKWSGLDISLKENPSLNNLFHNVRRYGLNRFYNFTWRNITILSNTVQFVIASIILLRFNLLLFILFFIFMIPELYVNLKYSNNIWGIYNSESPHRRIWSVLMDLMLWKNATAENTINATDEKFFSKMKMIYNDFFVTRNKAELQRLGYELLTFVFSQSITVVVYLTLIYQVLHREIPIGTFTFYISALAIFKNNMALFVSQISKQYQDLLMVKDLFIFIDLKNEIVVKDDAIVLPLHAPDIKFVDVSFKYPGTETMIFEHLNLEIPVGTKLAIVGNNGAGKSTLIKLLLRLYDVTSGQILIGGHDIRSIDLKSYYLLIGALFQDYVNYKFTVSDAINASLPTDTIVIDEIVSAAEKSGASEFIEKYEEQYQTQLGRDFEGGIDPSVGQWQKLAMARTFHKNPKLYILDEPTASIDADAEEKIFDALSKLPKDVSVILISHRFSTVRQADTIVVLEDNKIIEQGGHEELMKKEGRYYELFTKQAKGYQ